MPLFQKPVYYPPTVMDREAGAVLAIRVRTRAPAGGGGVNHFLPAGPTAGMRVRNAGTIQGGSFGPTNKAEFA